MQVKRVILTQGQISEINFDMVCSKWLIKNFSDGDIFVSFENNFQESEGIKIQSDCGQVVVDNEYLGGLDAYKHKSIYARGNGEIEVQQLCYC